MGKKGREIVKLKLSELINDLNRAIADEWLAAYQYWVFARIAAGINAPNVTELFEKQVEDEIKHASKLAERVVQLGGRPISDPSQLVKLAHIKYQPPPKAASNLRQMIQQALKLEAAAIEAYNTLAEKTAHKDLVTSNLVLELLEDEVHEEEALENLLSRL